MNYHKRKQVNINTQRNVMSKNLHIKKFRTKAILTCGIVSSMFVVGSAIYQTVFDIDKTSALAINSVKLADSIKTLTLNNNQSDINKRISTSQEINALVKLTHDTITANSISSSRLDLREQSGVVGRVENQGFEGLCWAYSGTTVMESLVSKKSGLPITELSPKKIDYMMVDSELAYEDPASGENEYANRYNSSMEAYYNLYDAGEYSERGLGEGSNYIGTIMAYQNPYVFSSEQAFWEKIKANDSNLESYESYEQVVTEEGSSILTPNPDGTAIYAKKQKYNDVNDSTDVQYFVNSLSEIEYELYTGKDSRYVGTSYEEDKNTLIGQVKEHLASGQPVLVFTQIDSSYGKDCYVTIPRDNNGDLLTDYVDMVFISKQDVLNRSNNICDAGGHAMVIVGWDDDYVYNDETGEKGVFILQNSWGDSNNYALEEGGMAEFHTEYYLSYSSGFDLFFFNSVLPLADYDNVYDIDDYKTIINSDLNEVDKLVYSFHTDGKEDLSLMTFSQYNLSETEESNYKFYIKNGDNPRIEIKNEPISYSGIYSIELKGTIDGDFQIEVEKGSGEKFIKPEEYADILTVLTNDHLNGSDIPICSADEELVGDECKTKTPTTCPTGQTLVDGKCQKKKNPVADLPETGGVESEDDGVSSSETGRMMENIEFAQENLVTLILASIASVVAFTVVFVTYQYKK